MRIRTEAEGDPFAEDNKHAKKREDRGKERRATFHQRPYRDAFSDPADEEHEAEDRRHAERVRPFVLREEEEPAESADHRPLADREIDDPGRADHQEICESYERIDAARRGRADGEL